MHKVRCHVFVAGRVQGVFFRAFTKDVAQSLGLKGWVKNLPDGRVEAVFEGSQELIEEALKKIRIGPPGARVDHIDLNWNEPPENLSDFRIRY
ncbi:MAG: acylphosphatase [Thermodesulfovibrionales bacterium]|nr:acylphosphatase [Thermodesulfovibrionales bacterium]